MVDRSTRQTAFRLAAMSALLAGVTLPMTGCFGTTLGTSGNYTEITSAHNSIRVNEQMQITSPDNPNNILLVYYVNDIKGGNSEVGTISATGLYTAPAIVPVPNTVTISDAAVHYPDHAAGTLALSILNPVPVIASVTPSSLTEGTTTVIVDGSQFIYGAQILWNGVHLATTFVSGTEVAAQVPAPNQGTFPLTVSNPNPGSADAPDVQVHVGPGQIVILLEPYGGTDVRVSNALGIPFQVTGTTHTGVTVEVNGTTPGNAQVGTAYVSAAGTITYNAPAVVPVPSNVVQLRVTSVDDPKVSVTQNISVLNPIPILTSAAPMTFAVGPSSVEVTGQKFIAGAQVLVNGAAAPTTFNSGGQLTASLDLTEAGNLDLQVLNPAPGPAASADLIALVEGTPPAPVVTPEDAARFLDQATFGATDADIHRVSMNGYQAWLNQQFSVAPTLAEPAVEQALMVNNPPCAAGNVVCNAALFEGNGQDEIYVQDAFWQQALSAKDELRQRVKYALHEILVVSSNNSAVQNMPRGEAGYYDLLGKDAFGNFRTLLNDVTLNPMMGQYLSMLGNDKGDAITDPDENFAREVMQLFTVGLYKLNNDGTQKLDGSGQPIPTYSNTDVKGLAAVFTGFSWGIPGDHTGDGWSNCCLYVGPGMGEDLEPMMPYPNHHSTAEKQFLGVTIAAGGSPDADGDLNIALNTLFHHPNLPPFFCRQLIEHLVTSNPSAAYVDRVASVFRDDGTGVRGNMQAVITAILLDPEARDTATDAGNPQYGKVREALLRYTEWARAFTAQSRTGSYGIGSTEDPIFGLGQMTLRSPTVFNWFAPGYVPPGTSIEQAGLVAPEMQMTNVSTVVGYLNYLQDAIGSNATSGTDIFSSYATEMKLAWTPNALMDRINLLLMAGEMDDTLRTQILGAVEAIAVPTGDASATNAALAARVETAIYLTMASPSFSAQF
ncbi:MAG TPA: DUF1800 family protein [Acidobacteriaceae bacterium]|jgi:uncharacterized protein (DUF1800 family)|nr:DUF1800 family protein [Acidobacteriaceae bacterium]